MLALNNVGFFKKFAECVFALISLSSSNLICHEFFFLFYDKYFTGSPTITSSESVKCNSSSVTLSCIIKTALPKYGFSPWIHSINGNYIRTLNGSMRGIESVLELTCSYQNTGEYTCTAWNEYGKTSLVKNKTISLSVDGKSEEVFIV